MGGAFGEVEREGGLVSAEVVDVEDEFFWEVFGGAPDDPADAGVDLLIIKFYAHGKGKWAYKAVFVAGNVDGDDFLEAEIPF